jgi:hypothetical protein
MRIPASALLFLLAASIGAFAQWAEPPMTGSEHQMLADRTNIEGMSGLGPEISAGLADPEQNARHRRAVVKVSTWGTKIVDPVEANGDPDANFIVYQLDNRTPVASGSHRMVFDDLAPGKHSITVWMADSQGHPEGEKSELRFEVP